MPPLSHAAPIRVGLEAGQEGAGLGDEGRASPDSALMGKVTLGNTLFPDCPQEAGCKRAEGSGSGDPREALRGSLCPPCGASVRSEGLMSEPL